MSNVRDIRSHPKFQPKLDPESPTYEAERYRQYLDSEDYQADVQRVEAFLDDLCLEMLEERDPLEDLEERPTTPGQKPNQ